MLLVLYQKPHIKVCPWDAKEVIVIKVHVSKVSCSASLWLRGLELKKSLRTGVNKIDRIKRKIQHSEGFYR